MALPGAHPDSQSNPGKKGCPHVEPWSLASLHCTHPIARALTEAHGDLFATLPTGLGQQPVNRASHIRPEIFREPGTGGRF